MNQGSYKDRRVNRILSLAGITSRRKADDLIKSGRVKINNLVIKEKGTRAVWGKDRIQVDDLDIPGPTARIYLMVNKPFGVISSLHDPEGRPVVTDLLKGIWERLYPVGRLDFDSLGLLLMTNDGEWAHRLMHPRYKVPRTYKLKVEGKPSDTALEWLRKGVRIDNGPPCRSKVDIISETEKHTTLRMTIHQGKSRQIRRMLDAVGYRVVQLKRTGFGILTIGNLKVGDYRHLAPHEVEGMMKLVGMSPKKDLFRENS